MTEAWAKFKKTGDSDTRDDLITNYLHLVKYVVGRMAANLPPHVKVDDMYSSGVVGLIRAVEKYDPEMKNKFETYAILLIKGAIIDEMRAMDWVPRSIHQKANKLSATQQSLQQKLGREPSDGELATELGLSIRELEELMVRVKPAVLIPLNADSSDDPDNAPLAERIPDQKAQTSFEAADRNEFNKLLQDAVMELPEQERMVLVLYYFENLMLKDIGRVLGVSESRVSQIHTKAITRLRGRLGDFMTEFASMI